MKVLFVSSEVSPYASTGGLGDVSLSLPTALRRAGATVWVAMPMYRGVFEGGHRLRDTGLRIRIPLGFAAATAEIWVNDAAQPVVYFVRRDEFFDRRELYSLPERDYDDNFERFVFFQKAVVAMSDALGLAPDIVHANDWTGGLLPLFLRHGTDGMGRARRERSVFTIHNLAYQGLFAGSRFAMTNLPFSCFSIHSMEFFGQLNCMKAGVTGADLVSTVSEGYAREIRTPEQGFGLEGVLGALGDRLVGIPNGIDTEVWDPARDRMIFRTFSSEDLQGKEQCKRELLSRLSLRAEPGQPLLGMVSRLVDHKGLDILVDAMPGIMKLGVPFVLLGSGQQSYHALCRQWMEQWPDQFHATIGFDPKLAHQIESAADLYLMPSRFEPCGLGQLYSLRYGAVPIVHATGGLDDSIQPLDGAGATGNGFKFREYSSGALLTATTEAVERYRADAVAWRQVLSRVMREDHSWDRSARRYLDLYARATGLPA